VLQIAGVLAICSDWRLSKATFALYSVALWSHLVIYLMQTVKIHIPQNETNSQAEIFMKLFMTRNIDTVKLLQENFGFDTPSV